MKKIKLMILVGILLLPIGVKAQQLFHNYDYTFDKDIFSYNITVDNDIDKLSVCTKDYADANRNNLCFQSENIGNLIPSNICETGEGDYYFLFNDQIVLADNCNSDVESAVNELNNQYELSEFASVLLYIDKIGNMEDEDFDDVKTVKSEENDEDYTFYGYIDNNLVLKVIITTVDDYTYDKEIYIYDANGNTLEYNYTLNDSRTGKIINQKHTIYNFSGEAILHGEDEIENSNDLINYFILGDLSIGNNTFKMSYKNGDSDRKEYTINIYRKLAIATQSEENIKSSPKTGSFTNIVVSSLLVLSLIVLLFFNRKYNKEG